MRVLSPREVRVWFDRARKDTLHADALAGQRLLQHELGAAALEVQPGDLVVEPRRVVLQAPVHGGVADARGPGQRAAEAARERRPAGDDHAALARVERVAERRADRLPDRG